MHKDFFVQLNKDLYITLRYMKLHANQKLKHLIIKQS
jgi:hypothetical protein